MKSTNTHTEIDILKLDHDIKKSFLDKSCLNELNKNLTLLTESLKLENISELTRENILVNIKNIEERTEDITTKKTYNFINFQVFSKVSF